MTTPEPSLGSDKPVRYCPFCGGHSIVKLTTWSVQSDEDPENNGMVYEYQCEGECQGRSFFV